jgi:hypothetical protein
LATASARDVAAGAGPVVDDDRLPPHLLQLRTERTGDDVGGAARREGHDDPDGLRRPRLRVYGRDGAKGAGGYESREGTALHVHDVSQEFCFVNRG